MLFSCLLLAVLLLLPAVGCALLLPAVGVALLLPAVGYALLLLFHHFSSAHSDEYRHPSVRRLSSTSCCVWQSGVASLVDFFPSLALLAVMLSLFSV